jgi:hypothetical protein
MWRPKVAKANNDIRHSKAENQTTLTMCVFCTFINFLFVNLAKHNNQQAFHLDFTSTLNIGKSHLPFLVVT